MKLERILNFKYLKKINKSCAFAIQCDETTDITQMSQLLVYIRYVGFTSIEKEMLFCKSLQKTNKAKDYQFVEGTTKAKNVFEAVSSYFDHNLIT